ncbi:MAG: GH3 auxin-responsive promoter family protein [Paracoccaceae bacterium]
MTGWQALRTAGHAQLALQAAAWANPAAAQAARWLRALHDSHTTAFGRAHGLHPDMSLADWRAAVPVRDMVGFQPWISRIIAGEPRVLTADPILAFELTGGSSGGRRAVPYTATLLDDFRAPILAWFGDLLTNCPGIAAGTAYFALSPALRTAPAPLGPYPIGLGSDLAYFGPEMAAHLGPNLLWHPSMETDNADDWAFATAAHLVAAENLSLISVWSPTFLSRLLDQIASDPALPQALYDGTHGLAPNPSRARQLDAARQNGLNPNTLWPNLALISAWADAASNRPAYALQTRLGTIAFQAKGLLATEGIFTLPILGLPHALPCLTACFLEFEDANGGLHLIEELTENIPYSLIVTTGGGLQRYRIGDRVTAMGPPQMPANWRYARPSPRLQMLQFAGRAATCDMVGEKLTEDFVLECLAQIPGTPVLAAQQDPPARYQVWLDQAPPTPSEYLTLLDRLLRHNPQYDYARSLCQLAPPTLHICPDLVARYTAYRLSLGHRLSDIKPPVLLAPGLLHPDNWATDTR